MPSFLPRHAMTVGRRSTAAQHKLPQTQLVRIRAVELWLVEVYDNNILLGPVTAVIGFNYGPRRQSINEDNIQQIVIPLGRMRVVMPPNL